MQVIPVIDIRGGVAVAAVRGDRARYRPLETPFSASADPVAVANGLRTLYPFRTLYIADLDGIEGRGADLAMQASLAQNWPGSECWVDDGFDAASSTKPLPTQQQPERVIKSHVLGSESLVSLADYDLARQQAGTAGLLSLDFRGDTFIGPPELLDDATLWPQRLIVMTLARVGSGEGPDIARLSEIIARAGGREIYAAGGIRNAEDLRTLQDIGVAGVLIASALHQGTISASDIESVDTGA